MAFNWGQFLKDMTGINYWEEANRLAAERPDPMGALIDPEYWKNVGLGTLGTGGTFFGTGAGVIKGLPALARTIRSGGLPAGARSINNTLFGTWPRRILTGLSAFGTSSVAADAARTPQIQYPMNPGEKDRRASAELRARNVARRETSTSPDVSMSNMLGGNMNNFYNTALGLAGREYGTESDALKRNLRLQLAGIGQERVGAGQDISTAVAQAGMDTSPSLDVALDSLATRAALQELAAQGDYQKGLAEAQAKRAKSVSSANLERQKALADAQQTQFGLILQALLGGGA